MLNAPVKKMKGQSIGVDFQVRYILYFVKNEELVFSRKQFTWLSKLGKKATFSEKE